MACTGVCMIAGSSSESIVWCRQTQQLLAKQRTQPSASLLRLQGLPHAPIVSAAAAQSGQLHTKSEPEDVLAWAQEAAKVAAGNAVPQLTVAARMKVRGLRPLLASQLEHEQASACVRLRGPLGCSSVDCWQWIISCAESEPLVNPIAPPMAQLRQAPSSSNRSIPPLLLQGATKPQCMINDHLLHSCADSVLCIQILSKHAHCRGALKVEGSSNPFEVQIVIILIMFCMM
jgi:hypothetical protein